MRASLTGGSPRQQTAPYICYLDFLILADTAALRTFVHLNSIVTQQQATIQRCRSFVPQPGMGSFSYTLCRRLPPHLQILSDAQDLPCNRAHAEVFLPIGQGKAPARGEGTGTGWAGEGSWHRSLGVRIVCVQASLPNLTSLTKLADFKVVTIEQYLWYPLGPWSHRCDPAYKVVSSS